MHADRLAQLTRQHRETNFRVLWTIVTPHELRRAIPEAGTAERAALSAQVLQRARQVLADMCGPCAEARALVMSDAYSVVAQSLFVLLTVCPDPVHGCHEAADVLACEESCPSGAGGAGSVMTRTQTRVRTESASASTSASACINPTTFWTNRLVFRTRVDMAIRKRQSFGDEFCVMFGVARNGGPCEELGWFRQCLAESPNTCWAQFELRLADKYRAPHVLAFLTDECAPRTLPVVTCWCDEKGTTEALAVLPRRPADLNYVCYANSVRRLEIACSVRARRLFVGMPLRHKFRNIFELLAVVLAPVCLVPPRGGGGGARVQPCAPCGFSGFSGFSAPCGPCLPMCGPTHCFPCGPAAASLQCSSIRECGPLGCGVGQPGCTGIVATGATCAPGGASSSGGCGPGPERRHDGSAFPPAGSMGSSGHMSGHSSAGCPPYPTHHHRPQAMTSSGSVRPAALASAGATGSQAQAQTQSHSQHSKGHHTKHTKHTKHAKKSKPHAVVRKAI
jgi:hypothetical protein